MERTQGRALLLYFNLQQISKNYDHFSYFNEYVEGHASYLQSGQCFPHTGQVFGDKRLSSTRIWDPHELHVAYSAGLSLAFLFGMNSACPHPKSHTQK